MKDRCLRDRRMLAAGVLFAIVLCGTTVAMAATPTRGSAPWATKTAALAKAKSAGARTSGTLEVAADSGIGDLELTGRTTTTGGSLTTDESGQYSFEAMYLYAGENVTLSMSAPAGTDFGLAVLDDSATPNLVGSVPPAYYSGYNSYPSVISFKAPYSGLYYVAVDTWVDGSNTGGSGDYSLDVTVDRAFTVTVIDPVPNTTYGKTVSVTGSVASRFYDTETPVGDALLSFSFDGRIYIPFRSVPLVSGDFYFQLPQFEKLYYLVQYEGGDGYSPSGAHTSANTTALLSSVSSSRYASRSYRLYGTLKPQHKAGTLAVRVYLWKYVSGHYKAMGYRSAKASNSSNYSSFLATYKFPSTGKWRLRAYHSDGDHLTTQSGYTYVTVK